MDQELKAKWVAALRSGEYKQGYGRLFSPREKSYCCLGVLCDVIDPKGWDMVTSEDGKEYCNGHVLDAPHVDPQGAISEYVDGNIIDKALQVQLANKNDSRNYNFTEIAMFIEANVEES